jgi:hypothetical protein
VLAVHSYEPGRHTWQDRQPYVYHQDRNLVRPLQGKGLAAEKVSAETFVVKLLQLWIRLALLDRRVQESSCRFKISLSLISAARISPLQRQGGLQKTHHQQAHNTPTPCSYQT